MKSNKQKTAFKLVKQPEFEDEEVEENKLCTIDIKMNEDIADDIKCSHPIIDSHYLTVPNMFARGLPAFHESNEKSTDHDRAKIRRKRSHSIDHVTTSGNSTPSRKLSVVSVDRHRTFSRISALSSNFLNVSISNIHRCSSAKNLFSFFANNHRGVRIWDNKK